MIHVKESDFPEAEPPEPNTHIVFDRKPMRVLDVNINIGVLDILLESRDPRELM